MSICAHTPTPLQYWLGAGALWLICMAPQLVEAYVVTELVRPQECPSVEVTCRCEVEAPPEEPEERLRASNPPATPKRYYWE